MILALPQLRMSHRKGIRGFSGKKSKVLATERVNHTKSSSKIAIIAQAWKNNGTSYQKKEENFAH